MGRWKRLGIIVMQYANDHDPPHVHLFEDRKRLLKFNVAEWRVIEGRLTSKARKALEALRKEGVFYEKPKI